MSTDELQARLEDHALTLLAEPHSRAQLVEALGKLRLGASRTLRVRVFRALRKHPSVYVWPPHGPWRGDRLCTSPPDPEPYLTRARREIGVAVRKLDRAGIPPEEVARTLFPDVPPALDQNAPWGPRPAPSGEHVRRELAERLVVAWRSLADPPARTALEPVLQSMGLLPIGRLGHSVAFDARLHRSEGPLQPHAPAVVVRPGWVLEDRVLLRARVRVAVHPPPVTPG